MVMILGVLLIYFGTVAGLCEWSWRLQQRRGDAWKRDYRERQRYVLHETDLFGRAKELREP